MKQTTIYARKIIYRLLAWVGKLFRLASPKVIVLCYHSISTDAWEHGVTKQTFTEQMSVLKKIGYHFISPYDLIKEIKAGLPSTKHFAVITFDDGYKDILSVTDIAISHSLKPTVFILANREKVNRLEMDNQHKLLTYPEVKGLQKQGWIIGSHSATHPYFSALSQTEIKKEVTKSKADIEKSLNTRIDFFAYPKGEYTENVLQEVRRAGFSAAFSMDDGVINSQTELLTIPRIGVNRTHSISEFKDMLTIPAIRWRQFLKSSGIGKLIYH